jgi:hypothetical protein
MLDRLKSYRFWIMWIAALGVILWYWSTDPFGGRDTAMRLQSLAWVVVFAGPAYWLRRAFADAASGRQAYAEAMKGNVAAAIVYAALCVMAALLFLAIAITGRAMAADSLTEPPAAGRALLPVLHAEQVRLWSDHPAPAVLGALVEQETCPSLTHPKCWSPRAELKTARELGFGLGQVTVAYRSDGAERFNRWAELRRAHAEELAAWTWPSRFDARLQLRALVLDNRSCYAWSARLVGAGEDALAFCDAAYNGGRAGVLADMRLCRGTAGCNPARWFGHVESTSTKSRARWNGYGVSAFEINRTHVRNVMVVRRVRYVKALEARS